MIPLSSLNKTLILFLIIFYSCSDDNINYVACSPNQILDSCGQCYYSEQDENWNDCLDECEIQYGGNICDLEGVLSGDCDCSGCPEYGDPAYCEDCLVDDYCSCNYNQLLSNFPVNIDTNCSDYNNCNNYSFDQNNLTFKIRERCGLLLNINANYIIESVNDINFSDPCNEPIGINYFEDQNQANNIFNGCDLPINTIYVLDNGDIVYNSSDDISEFSFSLFNHCEDKSSLTCGQTVGCTWLGDPGCQPDWINSINNGDANDVGFNIYSTWQNNKINISGISQVIVIPSNNDYINTIFFYNKDPLNSIYLKWANVIPGEEYIEIGPSQAYSLAHNNWCDESLGSLLINNDNLTIFSNSTIEGFFYNNNDYVKFGELEINLNFQSLIEFQQAEPEYCQ